tara:strand:- start:54 stop:635 length:582 start_codon:yes stop_codon:yes gene_type:complete
MKKILILAAAALSLAACAVTPETAPAGAFQTEADYAVTLPSDWSRWPSQINYDTQGEYLTRDGVLLNRLHFMSIEDGGSLVRARRDFEIPLYTSGSTEFEVVELVTSSLSLIGYSSVEADDIRPASFDGHDGLRFGLTGTWQNGLRVRGDVAAIARNERLDLVLFLAPELHYYDTLSGEVDAIMSSIDMPDAE